MAAERRYLNLNAYLRNSGYHEAAWRVSPADPAGVLDPRHYIGLARTAERGVLDSIFLPDSPGVAEFRSEYLPGAGFDPLQLLSSVAAVTEQVGLIATVSTTYSYPWDVARRLATLDFLSQGRAGWNILTTVEPATAGNFGDQPHPPTADRYDRAGEYVEVVLKLWDAWEDDAAVMSRQAGQWADPARLHVDRVFTIRGAGTVVTGTLWSGQIGRGDELEVLPQDRHVRVRGVQIHDQPVDRAAAGQRVAVNLTGTAVDELERGDVLVAGGSVRPTYRVDAELEFSDREPEHGERVQIHHGTREAPARLTWLGGRFWQVRLEQPIVPATGDRLVVRQIAPPDTLGGGRVLDPAPRRHGPSRDVIARLERLARGEELSEPAGRASPAPGMPAKPAPKPLSSSALALEARLREAGVEPPIDSEVDVADLAALREAGRAVRVSKSLHYHVESLAEIRGRLVEVAERHDGVITLAELRDELGTSRKFAQALLEHFDSEKVTIRRGDQHFLRRRQ